MQQVFPDEAAGPSRKPLIHFPLPTDECSEAGRGANSVGTRKRHRSSSPTEQSSTAVAADADSCHLTQEDRRALSRFIEYGDQPVSAVEHFRMLPGPLSSPAQPLTSSVGLSHASQLPQSYQWCCTALRQAMSVLCRVVRLDTNSLYLQPTSGVEVAERVDEAAAVVPAGRINTLELYCRYQALELELEDVVLRAHYMTQTDGVPETILQRAQADVGATVLCIEDSVNALEATVVEMLLHLVEGGDQNSNNVKSSAANAAAIPSVEYVAAILRGLPDVFQSEQWPARFVCNTKKRAQETVGTSLISSTCAAASLLGATAPSANIATAAYRAQVGGATTSLALRSLLILSAADVWNTFGVATASPISRLAALERLKGRSQSNRKDSCMSSPGDATTSSARPALDIEKLDFKDILVRAWNQGYSQVGLRRLHFEMQALFYQYITAGVSRGVAKSGSRKGATPQELLQLWRRWECTVQELYCEFMKKASGGDSSPIKGDDDDLCDMEEGAVPDAYTRLRRHATAESALTEVQTAALRVVATLRAADTNGWFAVPAFDLVNVDFTSVSYWIASPSFAHKSRREAYRSLCRVLERMVDCCVQKYGPTHAFSDAITTVRQQLVDVARGEGLL